MNKKKIIPKFTVVEKGDLNFRFYREIGVDVDSFNPIKHKTPQYKIVSNANKIGMLVTIEPEQPLENRGFDESFVKWLSEYNEKNNCKLHILVDEIKNEVLFDFAKELEKAFIAGREYGK